MKTFITTAHEEEYSNKGRTLGVLLNFDENHNRVDSLLYTYNKNMYVFFNTIIDMNDYILYGDNRVKRAYLSEDDFDVFYDAPHIEGKFAMTLPEVLYGVYGQ